MRSTGGKPASTRLQEAREVMVVGLLPGSLVAEGAAGAGQRIDQGRDESGLGGLGGGQRPNQPLETPLPPTRQRQRLPRVWGLWRCNMLFR